jgi:hypothetical protein
MKASAAHASRIDERAVVVLAEADYSFGCGPLGLRVEHVDWLAPIWFDGELWYDVFGVEVDPDGGDGPQRQVCVRGRSLPPRG